MEQNFIDYYLLLVESNAIVHYLDNQHNIQ